MVELDCIRRLVKLVGTRVSNFASLDDDDAAACRPRLPLQSHAAFMVAALPLNFGGPSAAGGAAELAELLDPVI